ncbi:lysosomal-associated transmembrane protein 4A isoform X2 [Halyomorpha halys]
MQGVAFKFGERRDDWKCCFCCHVRTATIFLGIWHLLLHMLTLSVVAVVIRHPEMVTEPTAPALPTPLSSELANPANYSPNSYGKFLAKNPGESQRLNVSIVVIFSTFVITLLMVYGAIKGKPSYLMPFFCLQLFDFCVTRASSGLNHIVTIISYLSRFSHAKWRETLTALTYLCYLPDMHRIVAESPRVPMQAQLLQLSPESLALIVLFTFVTAMLLKAYFIGVVWSCYKYLTLRLISAQRTLHLIEPESSQDLLPDYDTAVKFPPPPPPYNQAMSHPTA